MLSLISVRLINQTTGMLLRKVFMSSFRPYILYFSLLHHIGMILVIHGVNRPGVPWDTSWVFQLGCVGNVENMAKSRMPVRNLWKSE